MGAKASTEDVHGKNSIEAAAETTIDAIKAVKQNLEKGGSAGSNGRGTSSQAIDETKEYLRTISETASDVAGTAANALGAKIPEANKGDDMRLDRAEDNGRVRQYASSAYADVNKAGAKTSDTAQSLVDRANEATKSLEAKGERGFQKGKVSLEGTARDAGSSLNDAANSAKGSLDNAAENTKDLFNNAAKGTKDTLNDAARSTKDSLNSTAERTNDGIESAARSTRRSFDGAAKGTKDTLNNAAKGTKDSLDHAYSDASKGSANLRAKGEEVGEHAAEGASSFTAYIRDSIGKAVNQTEQAAHSLFPGRGDAKHAGDQNAVRDGFKDTAAGVRSRTRNLADDVSPSNSQRSWQQAADDKATEARKAVGDASQSAKDSAHSVYQNASEAVAATYHDVKDSAVATVTDLEEGAKSAIEKLKDRLDTSMEPTNDAEAMKSVGLVPSNTEDMLAARGRVK